MQEKPRNGSVESFANQDQPAVLGETQGTVERTLEQAIGFQVRHHRKLSNLTVAELALAAQISPGMLSKIENGQISPSLTTLQTLASALNVPFSLLFSSFEQQRDCSYVKSGEGVVVRRRGSKVGHEYQLVGQPIDGLLVAEPYLITLGEDAFPHTEFRHEGIEFVYMLTGEVEYAHADRSYRLTPGDTLMFNSAAPHGPSHLHVAPASYLAVLIYQRR